MDDDFFIKVFVSTIVVIILMAVLFGFAFTTCVNEVVKIEIELEENDSSLSREIGKLFGEIKNDFQKGIDDAESR